MDEERVQWEYTKAGEDVSQLNDLGKEGWEAYASNIRGQTLLKRKVVHSKPQRQQNDYDYGR